MLLTKLDLQVPTEVKWEIGTAATLNDYYEHQSATQTSSNTEKGLVTVISPGVVAVTRFDAAAGHWVLEAPGGDPFDLVDTDPNASDETLMQEISSYPVAYRTVFNRSHLPSKKVAATPTITNQPSIQ